MVRRVRALAAGGDAQDLHLRSAELVRVLRVDGLDEEAEGPAVVGGPVHEEVALMVADHVALQRVLVVALREQVALEVRAVHRHPAAEVEDGVRVGQHQRVGQERRLLAERGLVDRAPVRGERRRGRDRAGGRDRRRRGGAAGGRAGLLDLGLVAAGREDHGEQGRERDEDRTSHRSKIRSPAPAGVEPHPAANRSGGRPTGKETRRSPRRRSFSPRSRRRSSSGSTRRSSRAGSPRSWPSG